jgi:hypothetical protein
MLALVVYLLLYCMLSVPFLFMYSSSVGVPDEYHAHAHSEVQHMLSRGAQCWDVSTLDACSMLHQVALYTCTGHFDLTASRQKNTTTTMCGSFNKTAPARIQCSDLGDVSHCLLPSFGWC